MIWILDLSLSSDFALYLLTTIFSNPNFSASAILCSTLFTAQILGYRSRKSEILSGKRKLSLAMIRRLNDVLNIPAEALIQAY